MHASVASLAGYVDAALAFIFPEVCQLCGLERAARRDGYVCASCQAQVRWIEPPYCARCGLPYPGEMTTPFECSNCRDLDLQFDHARSAVAARGPVLEVIHRYKYQRALWFEPFLARLLVRRAAPELRDAGWDSIVPVPLYATKERQREFNQATRLGIHLGRATGLPVERRWVRRIAPTETQTQLSRDERALNVGRAFSATPGLDLSGRRIVLLDDVFTTGATTNACSRVLRAAGAAAVCVWTVARGL
jgi:ComF family protein